MNFTFFDKTKNEKNLRFVAGTNSITPKQGYRVAWGPREDLMEGRSRMENCDSNRCPHPGEWWATAFVCRRMQLVFTCLYGQWFLCCLSWPFGWHGASWSHSERHNRTPSHFLLFFSAGPTLQSGLLLPGCARSAASTRRNTGGCGQERKRGWDHSSCDLCTLTSLRNKTTNDFSPLVSPAPCHLRIGTAWSGARLAHHRGSLRDELPAHICWQPSRWGRAALVGRLLLTRTWAPSPGSPEHLASIPAGFFSCPGPSLSPGGGTGQWVQVNIFIGLSLKVSWAGIEENRNVSRFWKSYCSSQGPDVLSPLVALIAISMCFLDCQLGGPVL